MTGWNLDWFIQYTRKQGSEPIACQAGDPFLFFPRKHTQFRFHFIFLFANYILKYQHKKCIHARKLLKWDFEKNYEKKFFLNIFSAENPRTMVIYSVHSIPYLKSRANMFKKMLNSSKINVLEPKWIKNEFFIFS